MPSPNAFRKAVLKRQPDLAGRLWINKMIHDRRDYVVTVRGLGSVYWIDKTEPLDKALDAFFAELGWMTDNADPRQ